MKVINNLINIVSHETFDANCSYEWAACSPIFGVPRPPAQPCVPGADGICLARERQSSV